MKEIGVPQRMTMAVHANAVVRLRVRASVTTGSDRDEKNASGEILRKSEATGMVIKRRKPPKRREAPRAARAVPALFLPSDRLEPVGPEDLPALL